MAQFIYNNQINENLHADFRLIWMSMQALSLEWLHFAKSQSTQRDFNQIGWWNTIEINGKCCVFF